MIFWKRSFGNKICVMECKPFFEKPHCTYVEPVNTEITSSLYPFIRYVLTTIQLLNCLATTFVETQKSSQSL